MVDLTPFSTLWPQKLDLLLMDLESKEMPPGKRVIWLIMRYLAVCVKMAFKKLIDSLF
jgi:hypothetical protein